MKAELQDVRSYKLPAAERELKAVIEYGHSADEQVRIDTKEKRDFYKQRIVVLEDMIANAKIV